MLKCFDILNVQRIFCHFGRLTHVSDDLLLEYFGTAVSFLLTSDMEPVWGVLYKMADFPLYENINFHF